MQPDGQVQGIQYIMAKGNQQLVPTYRILPDEPVPGVVCIQVAIAIDSRNPLARFEAAGVLTSLERHEEALGQLRQLAVSVTVEHRAHGVCMLSATTHAPHLSLAATALCSPPSQI